MSNTKHCRLLILGSGPAGYTAAVYAARANLNPVLVTGLEQGGQLMTTTDVDNWPGDADGVQGPDLMDRMRRHAERFETEIIFDHINQVDLSSPPFTPHRRLGGLHLRRPDHRHRGQRPLSGPALGAGVPRPRRLRLRHLRRVLLPRPEGRGDRRRQHGGRGGPVPVQHRRPRSPWSIAATACARRRSCRQHLFEKAEHGNVRLVWNTTWMKSWATPPASPASASRAPRTRPPGTSNSRASSSPSATNPTPNSSRANSTWPAATSRSSSGTDGNATATSVPGVFAAGDVMDHVYRQAITSAGTGCMAALDAEKYLDALTAAGR